MGQYFKLVNVDKKEVVDPWALGGTAKFWEWIANPHGRVLLWLLRQSSEGGGGDIDERDEYTTLGRWAGDRVTLVGDYDASGLYQASKTKDEHGDAIFFSDYVDITAVVRDEFNQAVRRDGGIIDTL
jgi:hypothetical protein